MNVSNVVPSIMERLSIKDNSHVKSLVIESLDCSKKLVLNEDSFCRCSRKNKDTPKNLFELLKRLLSPKKDDVDIVVKRLSFNGAGFRVSADISSGKNISEVSGVVLSQGRGFTSVGASNASVEYGFLKIPRGIVADGYQNGRLVSSENHLPSGNIYYRDIEQMSDGGYKAGSIKDRAY